MISRDDLVFTIGFDGAYAVVDGKAKRQYGKLSTRELAEVGLYRAAFSSALYANDDAEMNEFIGIFNGIAGTNYTKAEEFNRLFGVKIDEGTKVLVL